jgi:D-glycerate 3-kinase
MQQVMMQLWNWNVVVLSIDDFYLTRAERRQLGETIHPLLATRGVPGTHDIDLLHRCLDELLAAGDRSTATVPRFDKGHDDRAPDSEWTGVTGPVDMILLEGWCVGTRPQRHVDLRRPVNVLESNDDAHGVWRRYVNEQLMDGYARLFDRLDFLVYLQIPEFGAVYRWRAEQERKLARSTDGNHVMSDAQIASFVQHYERLTRHSMRVMPDLADARLELGGDHQCVASYYQ